jgi:hypothetical protein
LSAIARRQAAAGARLGLPAEVGLKNNRNLNNRSFAVTDKPARYLAIGKLCLDPGWRTIEPGAEFEHTGAATSGMKPLNPAARKAKLASIGPRWREKRQAEIFRLSRSLGFTGGTDAEAATHIEKFIAETEEETTP